MLEKYEVCRGLFHGFDWSNWASGTRQERLSVLPAAQEHILAQHDGKPRLLKAVDRALRGLRAVGAARPRPCGSATTSVSSRLCAPVSPRASGERRGAMRTSTMPSGRSFRKAISPTEVIDIFSAAGLKKPDISILSDEFLAEIRTCLSGISLSRYCRSSSRTRSASARRRNVVQARSFSDDARASVPQVPEPRHRDRPGIEELIAARQGHARSACPRRGTDLYRG